ncbi:MAG: hypothetical protein ABI716_03270 [Candidatus Saccharibacteria bacterium]
MTYTNTLTSQSHLLQAAMMDALRRLDEKADRGRPLRLFNLSCFPSVHVVDSWPLPLLSLDSAYNEGVSYWLTKERKVMASKNSWWMPRLLLTEVRFSANGQRDQSLLKSLIEDVESL